MATYLGLVQFGLFWGNRRGRWALAGWACRGERLPTRGQLRENRTYWARFDLVVIDEFGFDRIERGECPQAASLFYKVIDARSGRRSTTLATNIDFEAWSEYLGDPPLAMAFLDRVVDGAILLKIRGKSYRAQRAKRPPVRSKHDTT